MSVKPKRWTASPSHRDSRRVTKTDLLNGVRANARALSHIGRHDLAKPSELELAAYLCSRVCHDVISPVGAIVNGLEVLDSEDDAQMHEFAMDLIAKSARQASAKLQYARLAFGAAGSAGAMIDLRDAHAAAMSLIPTEKIKLDWTAQAEQMPKDQVKLLMNLLMLAQGAIPRGGDIAVDVTPDTGAMTVIAAGTGAKVSTDIEAAFGDGMDEVTAHNVQPYYARLLADSGDLELDATGLSDAVRFKVTPRER